MDAKPKRQSYQFSLRQLFRSITCFAVALALISALMSQWNDVTWHRYVATELFLYILTGVAIAGGIGSLFGKPLLISIVFFFAAIAFVMWDIHSWYSPHHIPGSFLFLLSPLAIGTLIGAGIGALRHDAGQGACWGIFLTVGLCFVGPAIIHIFTFLMLAF